MSPTERRPLLLAHVLAALRFAAGDRWEAPLPVPCRPLAEDLSEPEQPAPHREMSGFRWWMIPDMKVGRHPLDWRSALRVAVLADADPKTVLRVMENKPTRPSVRVRIMAALLECGLIPPAPVSPSDGFSTPPEEPETP